MENMQNDKDTGVVWDYKYTESNWDPFQVALLLGDGSGFTVLRL